MNTCLPLELHDNIAANAVPALRWDGKTPVGSWREKCRAKLWELLGMDQIVPCKPVMTVTSKDEIEGNLHTHFTLQTEEGYFTHCDLLLPKNQQEKRPLCVCVQGHTKGSHISLGQVRYPDEDKNKFVKDYDFCLRAVKEGFAALAIEQRAFGQCGGTEDGPACSHAHLAALLIGRTLIGERVWDVMRAVDCITENYSDVITMEGSVLMGNSGGGTTTYYTACLEDRFSGYMPSCALCTYHGHLTSRYHCPCNYVPGIAKYFDLGDLAVMIAPKNLTMVCADNDPCYPTDGTFETTDRIQHIYQAMGAEEHCALVVGHDGHRFYADDAWPVMHRLLEQKPAKER